MENEALSNLIQVCHMLHDTGKVSGSGGNVSILSEGRMWITPTGVSLGAVNADNLVAVDMDGTWAGQIRPSKEYRMHLACYRARADIRAIVHVHSVYSVALGCIKDPGDEIPIYAPGYAMRVGALPLLAYYAPGSAELAESVASVIAGRNSVLLCNHGVLSVGQDMQQALNIMEEIEENSQLYFILQGGGRKLSAEDLKALGGKP